MSVARPKFSSFQYISLGGGNYFVSFGRLTILGDDEIVVPKKFLANATKVVISSITATRSGTDNTTIGLNADRTGGTSLALTELFRTKGFISLVSSDDRKLRLSYQSVSRLSYFYRADSDDLDAWVTNLRSLTDKSITLEFDEGKLALEVIPDLTVKWNEKVGITLPEAESGTSPYTYAFTGNLPAGVTRSGFKITGNPTTIGTFNLSWKVTDSDSPAVSITRTFTLKVENDVKVVNRKIWRRGTTDPSIPTSVKTAGHLPAGWSNSSQGPTVTLNEYSLTRTETTTNGVLAVSAWGNLTKESNASPLVTLPSIDNVVTKYGIAMRLELPEGTSGTPPYSYELLTELPDIGEGVSYVPAVLPQGLTLSGRVISGTPLVVGAFGFVWRVTDSGSIVRTAQQDFIIDIESNTVTITRKVWRLAESTPQVPSGGQNQRGHIPGGWSIVEPAPTTRLNVYSVSRQETDRDGVFTTTPWRNLTLEHRRLLSMRSLRNRNFKWGDRVGFNLSEAEGGTPPYTYTLTGDLPEGLSRTGRRISGIITETGTFNLSWKVEDSDTPPTSITRNMRIRVNNNIVIQTRKVYILSPTDPPIPVSGQNVRNHTPRGFVNEEPSPTIEDNVYSISRVETTRNGVFTTTPWGNLTKEANRNLGDVFLNVNDQTPVRLARLETRDHPTGWQIAVRFEDQDNNAVNPPSTTRLLLKYGSLVLITSIPREEFRPVDQTTWNAMKVLAGDGEVRQLGVALVNIASNDIDETDLPNKTLARIDVGDDLPFYYEKGQAIDIESTDIPTLPPLVEPDPIDLPDTLTFPPFGFYAVPGDEKVDLLWTLDPNAVFYRIQYKLKSGSAWITLDVFAEGNITIVDLTNDLEYEFQIQGVNILGTSDWSDSVIVTPPPDTDEFVINPPVIPDDPCDSTGSGITSYQIEIVDNSG